jgi:hypothetical protein
MKVAFYALVAHVAVLFAALLGASSVRADDADVLAIKADVSRQLFGSGTGVIVGIIDSGVKSSHPALVGNDSLGQPRLVAAQDFVGDGDTTADDISVDGHGTGLIGAILGTDSVHTGLAPDARYVNARVLNANTQFFGSSTVMNGVGYALAHGANVMNLSLNYGPPSNTSGSDGIDLILDYAAQQGVNITVAAGNIAAHRDAVTGEVVLDESPPSAVRSPGSAYNVVTVGRTGVPFGDPLSGPIGPSTPLNYNQVFITSASGPISSPSGGGTRDKPDLVAPGTYITLANNAFTPGVPSTYWTAGLNGTSISSALVSGMMTQQVGYGLSHGLSTNPVVIKATMMNSADQVLNKDGTPWQPRASSLVSGILEVTAPLDTDSGAGQINGARLFQQYSAGQQGPGSVNSIGWDQHQITGVSSATYTINTPQAAGSQMSVSLDWLRHIQWTDFTGDGVANFGDSFVAQTLDDLNLAVLINGNVVAESISTVDNEEFLRFTLPQSGMVSIYVNQLAVDGAPMDEIYGLAWSVTAVPEPSAIVLAASGAILLGWRRFRRA